MDGPRPRGLDGSGLGGWTQVVKGGPDKGGPDQGVRTKGVWTKGVQTKGVWTKGVRTKGVRTRGSGQRGSGPGGPDKGCPDKGGLDQGVRTQIGHNVTSIFLLALTLGSGPGLDTGSGPRDGHRVRTPGWTQSPNPRSRITFLLLTSLIMVRFW